MTARLLTFFLFILTLALPYQSQAQNKEVSDLEKAVFAFFSLAGTQPDYQQWIRNSEKFKRETDPKTKEEIYEVEALRLKWGMGTYSPARDFLKIRTPVKIFLQGTEQSGTLYFAFSAENPDTVPYFPFPYGKEWIALVDSDLDKFLSVPVTPEQFKNMTKMMKPNVPHDGAVILRVRATKADNKAPMKLDGLDQWLMMGETGYIELLYTAPHQPEFSIWTYEAPWYFTETEKELFPLLEQ